MKGSAFTFYPVAVPPTNFPAGPMVGGLFWRFWTGSSFQNALQAIDIICAELLGVSSVSRWRQTKRAVLQGAPLHFQPIENTLLFRQFWKLFHPVSQVPFLFRSGQDGAAVG